MTSLIILIVMIPIALITVLAVAYGIFISWVILFAVCGNKWCQDLWRSL